MSGLICPGILPLASAPLVTLLPLSRAAALHKNLLYLILHKLNRAYYFDTATSVPSVYIKIQCIFEICFFCSLRQWQFAIISLFFHFVIIF